MNLFIVIFIFALPVSSHASSNGTLSFTHSEINDEFQVCANYHTKDGWSEGYVVNAEILEGSELNERTDTFNYESYSHYAVLFWDYDQASII